MGEHDFNEQALSDKEIAEIYEHGDIDKVRDDLLNKLYEMRANQFQMDEYLNYVYHFKEIKKEKNANQECNDNQCEWNMNDYRNKLYSLTQTQLVHVMFYHTNDYEKICKAVRKDRFIQYVTPGLVEEKIEICQFGNDCKHLQKLLSKCRTLSAIKLSANTTRRKKDDDEIAHCLYFHEEYSEECQIKNCTLTKSANGKLIVMHNFIDIFSIMR